MKKSLKFILSLILVFLLAIVITGCSNKKVVENNTIENETIISTPETIDENNIDEEGLEVEGFIESNPDMISGATINEEDKFIVGAKQESPVYYSQIDSRWKNHPYSAIGKASQTIGSSGCGPTSSAMVVSTIKGIIRPDEMGDLYLKYGYRSPYDGTYFSAFQWTANYFGIGFKRVYNINSAIDAVREGYYVIASCGKGLFTTGGHFVVLYGIDGDTLKIYDPYLYSGKFDILGRSGKVTVSGNTVFCSTYNFKTYANSGAWFCFKSEGQQVDPTPTPEPTPTPSADVKNGVVNVRTSLNVRRGPGTGYAYVRSLYNGARVTIYETQNGWYRIGNREWVIDDYVRIGSVSPSTTSTVGQTRKLKATTTLYSNSNLTGYRYTYLANTSVKILQNVNANVDYIYIPATGRYAYVEVVAYTTSNGSSTPAKTSTAGRYMKFRTTYTYIYSNSNLTGYKYTYLANTQVKVLKNVSTSVDYIYVPATGRYGYVSTSVYK